MRPVYKKVKVAMPHCPQCGEQLSGNNSMVLPWKCSCGKWDNSFEDPLNYEIVKFTRYELREAAK